MSVAAQINTKVSEAITASEGGDFDTALVKLRSAKMLLASLPNSKTAETELEWDRAALDSLIADFKRELTAATGIAVTKHTYQRIPNTDDFE